MMNIKKLALLSLLSMPLFGAVCDQKKKCCDTSSHTFFRPRSLSQNLVLEESLWQYDQYYGQRVDDCNGCSNWLQIGGITPFYYQSTKRSDTAHYFLPCDKECVTVGQNNTSDVSSPWLGLLGPSLEEPFDSTICLDPVRKVIGGALRVRVDLANVLSSACDSECSWYKNWWFSVFLPVVNVRHDLNRCEKGSNNGVLPCRKNVKDALSAPDLCFSRMSSCQQRKTGVDDVAIKLGLDPWRNDCWHAGAYLMLFAPSGHASRADFLFEPTMGSGGHTGIGVGMQADMKLWECDESSLTGLLEARYAYFLKGDENRTFDLCNGEWSRYLQFVPVRDVVAPFPAANNLTRCVQVKPRSMFEVWASLNYQWCCWNLEVGYDFWYRQKESLCLRDCGVNCCVPSSIQCDFPCDCDVAILDIAGCCPRTSASTAKICQAVRGEGQPRSDEEVTPVRDCNLNLDSGSVPTAKSSTIYGAAAYDLCICNHPSMIGLGVSYEFGHDDAALSQVGVWLKLGTKF